MMKISTSLNSKYSLPTLPKVSFFYLLAVNLTLLKIYSHPIVDVIFESLSYCASLHPDPNVMEEEGDDEAFYRGDFQAFTGEGDEELSEVGRVRSNFVNDNRYQPY